MQTLSMKMGERLNHLRNQKNITQAELAQKLGCTQRSISYWESGRRDIPFDKLLEICKFFKVEPNFFFQIENLLDNNIVTREEFEQRLSHIEQALIKSGINIENKVEIGKGTQ